MASSQEWNNNILLVFGYIRQIQTQSDQGTNIPLDLINLIVAFLFAVVSDLTALEDADINIDKILDILHFRYSSTFGNRLCYTSIGKKVLIAMKSYQLLKDQDDQSLMNEYIQYQHKGVIPMKKPHPFALVAQALSAMSKQTEREYSKGHCIILQGVSGSGKVCICLLLIKRRKQCNDNKTSIDRNSEITEEIFDKVS